MSNHTQNTKSVSAKDQKVFSRVAYSVYLKDLFDKRAFIKAGAIAWGPPFDYFDMKKDVIALQLRVKCWVSEFAASEPQDVERLSETQKRTIISSLKGYCVQENWETLLGRLSHIHRDMILEVFMETLLFKELFARFFEAPFWYFDGKMDSTDAEGDEKFGARLQHLYERFLETNPLNAALWRSETLRLANSVKEAQAPSTKLGSYHRERRQALIGQLVDDILSIEPIQWLLRKPASQEVESKRRDELYKLCQVVAETASAQANMRGHFEFHRLDRLPETFQQYSKTMEAHTLHFLRRDSTRLDGRRVLMLVHPAIARGWIDECAISGYEISTEACVVVEDAEDPADDDKSTEQDQDE
ncbi:uncharacterized protein N7459_009579 [Penicillium hispanicum]|uniref:uncharacterized protein n=1 Tax=Penicillium hispanicum TaxID=1080232 RepID=UPI00254239A6|nr:uncharacterized protein N7459_009579 [Penicillium hispanicum]KAJ5570149.1 hypothetical protein N7459_009579 [Penicillium hispanicum]